MRRVRLFMKKKRFHLVHTFKIPLRTHANTAMKPTAAVLVVALVWLWMATPSAATLVATVPNALLFQSDTTPPLPSLQSRYCDLATRYERVVKEHCEMVTIIKKLREANDMLFIAMLCVGAGFIALVFMTAVDDIMQKRKSEVSQASLAPAASEVTSGVHVQVHRRSPRASGKAV